MVNHWAHAQDLIQRTVVFSKSYCPYCKATKSLLAEKVQDKSKLHIIELDNECKPHPNLANHYHTNQAPADGSDMQDALENITGQRSVPNIFINKKHIGGNDKIQALNQKGELDPLLKQVSAL